MTHAQSDSDKIERLSVDLVVKMKILEDSLSDKTRQTKKNVKDLEDL